MARSRRAFPSSRSSRLTQWIGLAIQGYQNVAGGGAILVASAPFSEPATIMRTRGMLSIGPQNSAADVEVVGAFGVGIVSTEAFNAGVASIPEPFTDADWGGWFVWQAFSFELLFDDATGVMTPNWNIEINSKAMRKVGPNESVVFICES